MSRPSSSALTPLGGEDPGAKEQGRAVRTLATLMRDIAETRAEIHRKKALVADLERRLRKELGALEGQLIAIRVETFRVLGRHLQAGWLNRKAAGILRDAVAALADEIETEYGVDLAVERRVYLEEDSEEVEARAFMAERKAYAREKGPASEKAGSEAGTEADSDGREKAWTGNTQGEDFEEGEAKAEARHGKGKGGAGARQSRPLSKAARKRAEKDQAMAGDIRALYLILARALHPDKEPNPSLREAKTVWMQKVTSAYAKKDLAMLLDILARNPLEAVGPYLSQAPLKTVQSFAKRLRRELAALRLQAETAGEWLHPFFARFLKGNRLDESAIARHQAELKKTVRMMKQRRDVYRTREGVEELILGLKIHSWRDLL